MVRQVSGHVQISSRRRTRANPLAACFAIALLIAAPGAAFSQDSGHRAGGTAAPTRNGGIYNFNNHQPTAPAPSTTTDQQVEAEVDTLLKQTDALDRTFPGGGQRP